MADFTPGPWHLKFGGEYIVGEADKDKLIGGHSDPEKDREQYSAVICQVRDIKGGRRRSKEEALANARLIAAAADLLAACQLAQKWLANCTPTCEIDGPKPLPILAVAIAKAIGEQAPKATAKERPQ